MLYGKESFPQPRGPTSLENLGLYEVKEVWNGRVLQDLKCTDTLYFSIPRKSAGLLASGSFSYLELFLECYAEKPRKSPVEEGKDREFFSLDSFHLPSPTS